MSIKRVVTQKAYPTHKIVDLNGVIYHNKNILLVTGVFIIAHKPIQNIFALTLEKKNINIFVALISYPYNFLSLLVNAVEVF